ncbi:MAG: carbohydrate ABC transporter permease, partial [Burkholderiales bacterium]|nr:carbohydrate ABC transporter permease [Anaerolineae bacterium]
MKSRRRLWINAGLIVYFLALFAPVLWMLSMSFKTNAEILTLRTMFPQQFTLANYGEILSQPIWRESFGNSLAYVLLNTAITLVVSIPAAYAFSRFSFTGDNHLFFWLLTNRMAPEAVFLLPYFQLYSAINLFDTPLAVALAHTLFSIPLAIWILEGFMSG